MTIPAKTFWSHQDLADVLKENTEGKLRPIWDAHPEIYRTDIRVDRKTRTPFLEFSMPLTSIFRNVSDIPRQIGELPVKLKYRPDITF